jgi:TRAP-type mannitol/chloroaromatic compound transport system permease small subunit
MKPLLALSRAIDTVNRWIGAIVIWFVLAAVLISAGNAVLRKLFSIGSNAYLELQWYLFAAVFLLGAAYTFLRNAHVRIDFVSTRLSPRVRNWVDIVGIVVFLMPLTLLLVRLSWPLVANAYVGGEMSQNAGGLIRWPVYALLPVGMALLFAQSLSELIKRVAFLRGLGPDSIPEEHDPVAASLVATPDAKRT